MFSAATYSGLSLASLEFNSSSIVSIETLFTLTL